MSTLYRVYVETEGPLNWVEYIEAETPAAAIAAADDDPEAPTYLVAIPLPEEIESECVCSGKDADDLPDLRLFKRIEATPSEPQCWECQNCHRYYVCPPDEIDWENERMLEEDDDFFWVDGNLYQRYYADGEPKQMDPYFETDETLYLED